MTVTDTLVCTVANAGFSGVKVRVIVAGPSGRNVPAGGDSAKLPRTSLAGLNIVMLKGSLVPILSGGLTETTGTLFGFTSSVVVIRPLSCVVVLFGVKSAINV